MRWLLVPGDGMNGFFESDIDLFIHGLDPPAAFKKLLAIVAHLSRGNGDADQPPHIMVSALLAGDSGISCSRQKGSQRCARFA